MLRKIIPTVFATSKEAFNIKLEKLIDLSHELQIDLMDGKFVDSESISLYDLPNFKKYKKNFEAHLMVENPEDYVSELFKKGVKKIIFHYESFERSKDIFNIIENIKSHKMKAFIAINPETDVKKIFEFLHFVDGVLFMGVYPGKEKQKFIETIYGRINEVERFNSGIITQVDGGIDLHVAKELAKLGVDIINVGSFISSSKNPEHALRKIRNCFF